MPSATTFFNTEQLKFILLGKKINITNLEIFIKIKNILFCECKMQYEYINQLFLKNSISQGMLPLELEELQERSEKLFELPLFSLKIISRLQTDSMCNFLKYILLTTSFSLYVFLYMHKIVLYLQLWILIHVSRFLC